MWGWIKVRNSKSRDSAPGLFISYYSQGLDYRSMFLFSVIKEQ